MRLIDADALKEKMTVSALGGHKQYWVCRVIDDAPTIEAEPVKHGRWIFKSKINLVSTGKLFVSKRVYTPQTLGETEWCEIPRGKYFFEKKRHEAKAPYCSICGVRGGDDWYDKTPYCSNCGARMDGDNDG